MHSWHCKALWIKKTHPNNTQSCYVDNICTITSAKRHLHVLDSDVCSKHGVKNQGIIFFIKQNENI